MKIPRNSGFHCAACGRNVGGYRIREVKETRMLILTRRVGESIKIGNDVSFAVLGVKGNQVRVGIDAPKNVAVHREEVFERIKTEPPKT